MPHIQGYDIAISIKLPLRYHEEKNRIYLTEQRFTVQATRPAQFGFAVGFSFKPPPPSPTPLVPPTLSFCSTYRLKSAVINTPSVRKASNVSACVWIIVWGKLSRVFCLSLHIICHGAAMHQEWHHIAMGISESSDFCPCPECIGANCFKWLSGSNYASSSS